MTRVLAAIMLLAAVCPAAAAPSGDQLGEAVELGGLAALAPLCGIRDQAWSEDLRRGTIQSATGSLRPDDPALKAAPGSELVIGALSYAETEATEDFAEAPAAVTCDPLRHSKVLAHADEMVRRFRAQPAIPGS